MKIYADENIELSIIEGLRRRGIDVDFFKNERIL